MAAIWRAFAIWLLFSAGTVQAQMRGHAVVTLTMTPDAVHASIELDRGVDRFAFSETTVMRESDFELLTPGLTLQNSEVRASKPFRRFELRINPTVTERDATYPAHYRVGRGGVVYAPALRGKEASWRTDFRFNTGPAQVRLPMGDAAEDGFVFIGPPELRKEDSDLVLIVDPKSPAWIVEQARAALSTAVSYYARSTGIPLPTKPLLIIRHWNTGRNTYAGDVTPGFVTTVRFHGPAWESPDVSASKLIESFLFHEAFHLWNGALASNAEGTPAWLHEGGAEYAALLAGRESGALTESDVQGKLSEALQRCRIGLEREGDKGLAQITFLSNEVRYPCGMVLQWAAHLHLRKAAKGKSSFMEAWAQMIRAARSRPAREYTLADFYASTQIADANAFAPGTLLVERSGSDRWAALPTALNALGADVQFSPPTPEARRQTLLVHLLRQNCGNSDRFGFSTEAGAVKLDTPTSCGSLAGSPVVTAVEGSSLLHMSAEAFTAVQNKCAAKAAVTMTTADARTLSASCSSPLRSPPRNFVVRRWAKQPPL